MTLDSHLPRLRGWCSVAAALLCLRPAAAIAQVDNAAQGLPTLVFENGLASQYALTDGVMTLRNGSGWVRTRRLANDFVLTMEFRLADNQTEAGVGIRTLTDPARWPRRGYRLRLSAADDSGIVEARRARATPTEAAHIGPLSTGAWHALVLSAEGPRVTATIDGTIASVTLIDDLVGCVLFDVRRGTAEFRNVTIRLLPNAIPAIRLDAADDAAVPIDMPRLRKEVRPSYPASAKRRRTQGVIEMEVIVLEDGRVGPVWVTKLADPELEQAAVAAVTRWRFTPAKQDGVPVPAYVTVQLTFTLR